MYKYARKKRAICLQSMAEPFYEEERVADDDNAQQQQQQGGVIIVVIIIIVIMISLAFHRWTQRPLYPRARGHRNLYAVTHDGDIWRIWTECGDATLENADTQSFSIRLTFVVDLMVPKSVADHDCCFRHILQDGHGRVSYYIKLRSSTTLN